MNSLSRAASSSATSGDSGKADARSLGDRELMILPGEGFDDMGHTIHLDVATHTVKANG